MIGEKINEFDKSDGTVETFNEMFLNKLDYKNVLIEIGDIVGRGKETVRRLSVYNKNNYLIETIEYDFEPRKEKFYRDISSRRGVG